MGLTVKEGENIGMNGTLHGKLRTALILGLGPDSKGCDFTSLTRSPSPGSSNELRSILRYALFTGIQPTADFRSRSPKTLISMVTSWVSGLNMTYTMLYSECCKGSQSPKLIRISPSSECSVPILSLCQAGVGAELPSVIFTTENYVMNTSKTFIPTRSSRPNRS